MPGTIVQLFGCVSPAADAFHLTFPQPGMKIARLVSNTSGLCLTSGGPKVSQDALVTDPVIHEYIRHGYISALQHWDDISSAVRQSQNHTARKVPAIWGNQWGLPGTFPISTLMGQTSDVIWIEGPPADTGVTAWNALTYKVGDASGDFEKPVFTVSSAKPALINHVFRPMLGLFWEKCHYFEGASFSVWHHPSNL